MCQAVKCQDFFFIFTLPSFDDSLSLFVSEATVALDNGTGDMRLLAFGILIQLDVYKRQVSVSVQGVSTLSVPSDLHECPFLPTAESRIPAADGVTYL